MSLDLSVLKWDYRFLDMAQLVAGWSKDPSTQVGAVIVDPDRRVVSLGYNGFPIGVSDNFRLDNREIKYKMVVHAESNALLFSSTDLSECTMYTYPFMPCPRCAGMIIQVGINRVVSYKTNTVRWAKEFETSRVMFEESDVVLTEHEDEELARTLR
jgi:dCMP deaminase